MTNGYIVASEKKYLSRLYQWKEGKPEDAYVFPEWQISDVIELAEGLFEKPTHLFAATFEDGVVTVGEKFEKVV